MYSFLGLDEAGYGPNLGPLVVSVTRWSVPTPAAACDLYGLLADAVSAESHCGETRLHVADSKQVYSPGRGLGSLETTALALLAQLGRNIQTLHDLWNALGGNLPTDLEPWFADEVTLPLVAKRETVDRLSGQLRSAMERSAVRIEVLASDIVQTARFNRLTMQYDSKGAALSNVTLGLLARHWSPDRDPETLVVLDKHGGRNRYDNLLLTAFPETFPQCLAEGRECSRYRVGRHECRFQTKAEAHLPVAAASILSKYTREVSMEAFNRFWQRHAPELKGTKGYPEDAARFRRDVQPIQQRLRISDEIFWRSR